MIYDIRNTEYAKQTLSRLTEVPISVWKWYNYREQEYQCIDDLVLDVVKKYGKLPDSYTDWQFVFFHITTSANECESFNKHGILDLKHSYSCCDSELRKFLDDNNICIDLDAQELSYCGRKFDISFVSYPQQDDTIDYYCWSIGRKLFYDYAVCGFLSICNENPYGGMVHFRPEFLDDIDNLLGLDLSEKWISTHNAYEIVAKVSGEKIVYDGYDDESEKDKVLKYLTIAYFNAFKEPDEKVLILKNNVQVPPSEILNIASFQCWDNN